MNKRALGALALVIILLMGIVAVAGLDNLPRDLRSAIAAAATRVETDRAQIEQNREYISRVVREEPVLFRTKAASYTERLAKDHACLATAEAAVAA